MDYFSSPEFRDDLDGYDEAIKAIIDGECRADEELRIRHSIPG